MAQGSAERHRFLNVRAVYRLTAILLCCYVMADGDDDALRGTGRAHPPADPGAAPRALAPGRRARRPARHQPARRLQAPARPARRRLRLRARRRSAPHLRAAPRAARRARRLARAVPAAVGRPPRRTRAPSRRKRRKDAGMSPETRTTHPADGTLETRDGRHVMRYERRLAHPVERVWAALTEPSELSGWLAAAGPDP